MAREAMIYIPPSILERAIAQMEMPKSPLENLPHELLIQICRYTDIFSLVQIATCSTRLADFIHTARLLDFDPDDLSTVEATFILDSTPYSDTPCGNENERLPAIPVQPTPDLCHGPTCKYVLQPLRLQQNEKCR